MMDKQTIFESSNNQSLVDAVIYKGTISAADEFPTLAEVQVGWYYKITANVTDNDATKTNTGQSFSTGDDIIWNGTDWDTVGSSTPDLDQVTDQGATTTNAITVGGLTDSSLTATTFVYSNGSKELSSSSVIYPDEMNGRIGIGTSSPSALLHLQETNTPTIYMSTNDGTAVSDAIRVSGPNSNAGGLFIGGVTGLSSFNAVYIGNTSGNALRVDSNFSRVSVGTGNSSAPSAKFQVRATTEQMRLDYDVSNYTSFTTQATGYLRIDPTGSQIGINTTPSGAALDVLGNIKSRGLLYFGTSLYGYITSDATQGFQVFTTDSGYKKKLAITNPGVLIHYYDTSNYMSTTIDSSGNATLNLTGTSPEFTFSDPVNVPDEAYGAGWNGSLEVPTKNAIYDKIETISGGGLTSDQWLDLSGTYASASTFTYSGDAADAANIVRSLFTCQDSGASTRRIGYVKSASHSAGTITVTVVTDTDLVSGDINFKITPYRKAEDYRHLISVPGEVVADASNPQGVWLQNLKFDAYLLPVNSSVLTAAAGAGAACAWNVYADATNLFTSAQDMTTSATFDEKRPNTNTISATDNVTLRLTSSAGATNKASNFQAELFIVPQSLYQNA